MIRRVITRADNPFLLFQEESDVRVGFLDSSCTARSP